MKKAFKILLVVLIVVLFVGTIGFLYNKSKKRPVIYETESPFISNITKKTVATGSVVPREEVEIKPHVSGIVQKIYIEAGDMVKKGDLIAKIEIIPDMVNLNNAESRLNKAQINIEDAKQVYDRQKKVFEEGVIPEAEFQQYKVNFDNAREEFSAAENNLQLIREGVTKRSSKTSNTLIKSTITGMVLDVPVEVGHSVIMANTFNIGTTIATVANMGDMIFKGKIDESEVGKIKSGMDLLLTIGAIERDTFIATLEYIAPKGMEENGAIQFEIRADVSLQEEHFIRAGYSANANIVLEQKDSILVLPEAVIQFGDDTDSAFVEIEKEPQVFEKTFIEVGLSDGINIEVLSGLTEEDKVKGSEKID